MKMIRGVLFGIFVIALLMIAFSYGGITWIPTPQFVSLTEGMGWTIAAIGFIIAFALHLACQSLRDSMNDVLEEKRAMKETFIKEQDKLQAEFQAKDAARDTTERMLNEIAANQATQLAETEMENTELRKQIEMLNVQILRVAEDGSIAKVNDMAQSDFYSQFTTLQSRERQLYVFLTNHFQDQIELAQAENRSLIDCAISVMLRQKMEAAKEAIANAAAKL